MAIDDENKRRSVHEGDIPPVPDGTIDADDRQHISGYYRGVPIQSATDTGRTRSSLPMLGVG